MFSFKAWVSISCPIFLLTPWSRVRSEKLPVPILGHENQIHTQILFLRKSTVILFSLVRLGLTRGLYPSGFPIKIAWFCIKKLRFRTNKATVVFFTLVITKINNSLWKVLFVKFIQLLEWSRHSMLLSTLWTRYVQKCAA